MIKILLLLLLVYLIYQLWNPFPSKKKTSKRSLSPKKNQIEAHPMVQCVGCETFVPKDESINYKGKILCSEKCREEYKSA